MKQAIKRTIARFAPADMASGLRILLYHAVEDPDPQDALGLRVPPEVFRAQMALLRDEGRRVVPLAGLLGRRLAAPALLEQPPSGRLRNAEREGARPSATPPAGGVPASVAGQEVAITFDDGYASQLAAADILEEFGFPATLFVVPAFLDASTRPADGGARSALRPADRPSAELREHAGEGYWDRWGHFGWKELAALAARGFEIGVHSATHPERLTRCSEAELEREIAGAKRSLEGRLGRPVTSFSYPHGAYNEAVTRAVEEAGYRLACTSVAGINRQPWPWFALRRTEIAGTDGVADVQRKLQGKYDWVGPWHQWRAAHA